MTPPQLVKCEACGIATRQWQHVVLTMKGRAVVDLTLCQRDASTLEDACRRVVREAG